jgi:hypothetical protein
MGPIYKLAEPGMRLRAEYQEAALLLDEKRQVMARVVEIDRALRHLSKEEPQAVESARLEIPFRRSHGRKKREKKPVPAGAAMVVPPANRPDFTA